MYTVFSKNKELQISENEWSNFCSKYQLIEAAGGLVKNNNNEYLMIFRNGLWDLPKGKREEGESLEQNALREVMEECGIDGLELQKLLMTTYHTYMLQGVDVLKATYWYAMNYNGEETTFTPQIEEGIEIAAFIANEKMAECYRSCYPSIKAVLNTGNAYNPL